MSKKLVLRIGSKGAEFPKMIGSFLIALAVIMLIQSGAKMFDTWQALKDFEYCVGRSGILEYGTSFDPYATVTTDNLLAQMKYQECRQALFEITGTQVPGGQTRIERWNSRQFWIAMLTPLGNFFFWAIILLIGLFMYNNNGIVLPVESVEFNEMPRPKRFAHRK